MRSSDRDPSRSSRFEVLPLGVHIKVRLCTIAKPQADVQINRVRGWRIGGSEDHWCPQQWTYPNGFEHCHLDY